METGGFDETRVKHLEMIQAVVARLAGNSFVVKGWALTLASVFFGFSISSHDAGLALASIAPTIIFWALDTYFLRAERLFRGLYDHVRRSQGIDPFFLGATSDWFVQKLRSGSNERERSAASWWRTALSLTLSLYYVAIIVAALVIACLVPPEPKEIAPVAPKPAATSGH